MPKLRVVLVAVIAACGSRPSLAPNPGPTLLVTNEGLGRLVVYDEQGRLVTVMPHEARCVPLRNTSKIQALLYSIEGQTYSTPAFDPLADDGWRLDVGTTPATDRVTLRPDEPCQPATRGGREADRRLPGRGDDHSHALLRRTSGSWR